MIGQAATAALCLFVRYNAEREHTMTYDKRGAELTAKRARTEAIRRKLGAVETRPAIYPAEILAVAAFAFSFVFFMCM